MDFEKGDVVSLRSGGPQMTVRKLGREAFGHQSIWCVWFDKAKKLDAAFDAKSLEKLSKASAATM
jgi:uncharacterized protein YodC (DUF2158 family)